MPAGVDHDKWRQARKLAGKEGEDGNWKYVMSIYKKLTKEAAMDKKIDGTMQVKKIVKPTQAFKRYRELNEVSKKLKKESAARVVCEVLGKNASFVVEVAEGPMAEMQGLAGRDELPPDHGMLFKRADAFWMKGVNFDLDIMFMDKQGNITDIQTMSKLAEHDYPVIYRPAVKSAVAIELPAGWCKWNNVKPGDKIQVVGVD